MQIILTKETIIILLTLAFFRQILCISQRKRNSLLRTPLEKGKEKQNEKTKE